MNFFKKLFGKKEPQASQKSMEDYMSLIRVYFQASIASNLGISNLAMLPDLRLLRK